jgi:hypothetical protein
MSVSSIRTTLASGWDNGAYQTRAGETRSGDDAEGATAAIAAALGVGGDLVLEVGRACGDDTHAAAAAALALELGGNAGLGLGGDGRSGQEGSKERVHGGDVRRGEILKVVGQGGLVLYP